MALKINLYERRRMVFALCGMAGVGGIAVGLMGLKTSGKRAEVLKNAPYYQEALHAIYRNEPVVEFLGKPIKLGKVDFGDDYNQFKATSVQYRVPFQAPKHAGDILIWARKLKADPNNEKQLALAKEHGNTGRYWQLKRVEIRMDHLRGKRLLVYKSNDENLAHKFGDPAFKVTGSSFESEKPEESKPIPSSLDVATKQVRRQGLAI